MTTKSQHTPGPWKAETNFRANDWGVTILGHTTGASSIVVADMPLRFKGHGPQSGHATQEYQWANARLIAQAPKMLDVIKTLAGQDHGHTMSSPRETCIRCDARAILKEIES